jgi:hypothetical protein
MLMRLFPIHTLGAGGLLCALAATGRAQATTGPIECSTLTPAIAASSLRIAKAKPGFSAGHTRQPPNQMDVVECSYHGAGLDPEGPTLKYTIYTPKAGDIQAVYSSLITEKHANFEVFTPSVGTASRGLVGQPPTSDKFEAFLFFMTGANVFRIDIANLPSAAAAKAGAIKVAAAL